MEAFHGQRYQRRNPVYESDSHAPSRIANATATHFTAAASDETAEVIANTTGAIPRRAVAATGADCYGYGGNQQRR